MTLATAITLGHAAFAQERSEPLPPPLEPALAVSDEFQGAVGQDSSAALLIFILRHPDDPLADAARDRLAARSTPDPAPAVGPEADILADFDAARRAGDPGALDAVAIRYADHPIAAEARRAFWRQ